MVPYLAGYLALTSPDGCCTEIFNSCRVKANASKPGRATAWKQEDSEEVWQGYCNWQWDDIDYSDETNPDPWHDPQNPASTEVAGFIIDPPDGEGHGFYLEPAGEKRIRQATTFEPLEMYFTGTIVSCTSRGEAYLLKWMDEVLSNCAADCEGWEATVFSDYPCFDEFHNAIFTNCGNQKLPGNVCEPSRPDLRCCDAEGLIPGVQILPFLDTGRRRIRGLRYRGYEQLDEGLRECRGNRYKFCFDVYEHCWIKPGIEIAHFNPEWDRCNDFCTEQFDVCQSVDVAACQEVPVIAGGFTAPVIRSSAAFSSDTVGGLIAVPGRYVRPDRVHVLSRLTPQLNKGRWVPDIEISNGGEDVHNLRISIWPAIDHVPPPDTEQGWCYYRDMDPCWRADIYKVAACQTLRFTPYGNCEVTCQDGTAVDGSQLVDKSGGALDCPGRFWVTIEACPDQSNQFTVRATLNQVEKI